MVARYRLPDDQSPSYIAKILYFSSLNASRMPVSSNSKKPLVIVGTAYSMPASLVGDDVAEAVEAAAEDLADRRALQVVADDRRAGRRRRRRRRRRRGVGGSTGVPSVPVYGVPVETWPPKRPAPQ